MKGRAALRVSFAGRKQAEDALRALKGEEESGGRMASRVSLEGNELVVEAEGADIVALRAALNAYLRYLQEIENVEGGKNG